MCIYQVRHAYQLLGPQTLQVHSCTNSNASRMLCACTKRQCFYASQTGMFRSRIRPWAQGAPVSRNLSLDTVEFGKGNLSLDTVGSCVTEFVPGLFGGNQRKFLLSGARMAWGWPLCRGVQDAFCCVLNPPASRVSALCQALHAPCCILHYVCVVANLAFCQLLHSALRCHKAIASAPAGAVGACVVCLHLFCSVTHWLEVAFTALNCIHICT